MTNTVLEINELCKDYPDFSLRNVSFSLPMGSIMGFVGQNGAGKTTTIRLILNMINRESGEIKIFGLDNVQDEQKIKQDIAVVFDDTYFVENWKVSEVEKALKGFYNNWSSTLFTQYVKSFHLSANKKVKELSKGMKMKLMLAVAMSHEARLLILDVNGGKKFGRFLSHHSFTVYVIHAPILVFLALALRGLQIQLLLKFCLAAMVYLPLSFGIAWIIQKIPYVNKIL